MNIKLAEKVFGGALTPLNDGFILKTPDPRWLDFIDYNQDWQKLKLIEWLFKWTRKAYEDGNHLDKLDGYRFQIEFAITTDDTEKLISIAEGMLNE